MRPPSQPVEELERARFVAMTRQDVATLDGMLAPDLTYCHSDGQCEDKSQFLETIGSGRVRYKDIRLETLSTRTIGAGTTVINGTMSFDGERAGQAVTMRLSFTDIYVKRGGRWQLMAWQSTRIQ